MKKILLPAIFSLCLIASPLMAKEIDGVKFAPVLKVEGKDLKFIGAGLRTKFLVHVYTMGAYTASGACNRKNIINNDEAKSLLMVMLRNVSAERMKESIIEAFDNQLPDPAPEDLINKRNIFQAFFRKELKAKDKLQFDYLPAQGLTVTHNGKELGTISGKEFAKVFFKIYFSDNTCCPSLQEGIMECESK